MNMAWIYAMLDQHEAANNAIERASALLPDDPYIDFTLGLIQNRQGASDLAIASFENAVQKGYPIQLLAVEPHLARLRTDSRFSALVNRDRME
jgi:tetratricopeptide (TPR) repeat protein